ncbi:MAG: dihydrodipicolinate synthase family protein [Hyphomicrobiales bacterium]|nr:dihydrodipicolinate synthase family protein [Hyphomicrobiales bacterium]
MLGVIAAVPTPVDDTGNPQKELFVSHCSWVLENGCDGLNILGSTGEANSFDTRKRKKIMRWAAKYLDNSRLMVGTGTPSLAQTIKLTKYADKVCYGVALVLPPYYYKPVSDEGLISWYSQLHKALGKRKIAIYFYNFPQMTGLTIPQSVIEHLQKRWPERFTGIKDSSGNLEYCRELAAKLPDFGVFPSSEVSLGEADKSGFAGCISATTNQTAKLCSQLWESRKNPDQKLVSDISDLRNKISETALIPSIKYLVAQRTNQVMWENLIPPFKPLNDTRKAKLDSVVEQLSGS